MNGNFSIREYIILLFLLSIPSLVFLINPSKFPADDCFFYPQIAHNFVNGHGFSFNQVYQTNGFHPLWMLICISIEFLNPFGKEFVLYPLWIISFVLFISSIWLLRFEFTKSKIGFVFSYGFLTYIFLCIGTVLISEALINLFTISLLLLYIYKKRQNYFLFGVLLSLSFLSRLDNLFVLMPLSFYYFLISKHKWKCLFLSGLGFSILVSPYLLFNKLEFGHFVPISGLIKSSFPIAKFHGDTTYGDFFLIIQVIYLGIILISKKESHLKRLKLALVIGSFFQLLYNWAFQSQIGQWYFVVQLLILGLFINDFIYYSLKSFSIKNRLVIPSIILVFMFMVTFSYLKLYYNLSLLRNVYTNTVNLEKQAENPLLPYLDKIKQIIPKEEKVFVYDAPGRFAFYSEFKIIPADGLVNNYKYSDIVLQKGINQYLEDIKMNYIILPDDSNKEFNPVKFVGITASKKNDSLKMECFAPIKRQYCGTLDLNKFNLTLKQKNPLLTWQTGYNQISLWKRKKVIYESRS